MQRRIQNQAKHLRLIIWILWAWAENFSSVKIVEKVDIIWSFSSQAKNFSPWAEFDRLFSITVPEGAVRSCSIKIFVMEKFANFTGWQLCQSHIGAILVSNWEENMNPNIHNQMHLNILPKLWLSFCCHQQKTQKANHFWHFMTKTLGVNMITKQNDPFFLICSLNTIRWHLSLLHLKTVKIQFHGLIRNCTFLAMCLLMFLETLWCFFPQKK